MKMKNNKGFTLAELLIVMAIIVVLAAIAVPSFAKQLETSRESSDVENIRAAASSAFSECYTTYITDNQVLSGSIYYSTIYQVKFNQHEATFQYMTPVIEVGTSMTPGSTVSGAVTIRKTPDGMVAGDASTPLPGNGFLQFQFTVSPAGEFYLTDILGSKESVAVAKAYGGPASGTGAVAAAEGFASLKPDA